MIAIRNIADQLVESGESLHARGTSARGMREAIKKNLIGRQAVPLSNR